MDKQFEEFVVACEKELFQKEKFEAIGKGQDYVFQALAFTGQASGQLSIATTILSELKEVPEELKSELKNIQQQLSEFAEKVRKTRNKKE